MKKALLVLFMFLLFISQTKAQHFVEGRVADTRYRYLDWSYTFPSRVTVDIFYIGVPGNNEFNLGLGYAFKSKVSLTLTPLMYAVIAKENGQKGIKLALLVNLEREGWKVNSFLAHYIPLSGRGSSYQVLDTLDITRVFKCWEVGVSNGFFHQEGSWNPQTGPILKFNDSKGAWAISYRFGSQRELRVGRAFVF